MSSVILSLVIAAALGLALRGLYHLIYRPDPQEVLKEYQREGYQVKHSILPISEIVDGVAVSADSVLEELIYRLWLLLIPSPYVWIAAVMSSLVFSATHVRRYGMPFFYMLVGAVLCGSLLWLGWWASIVTHLTFNLSGLLYVHWVFRQARRGRIPLPCPSDS